MINIIKKYLFSFSFLVIIFTGCFVYINDNYGFVKQVVIERTLTSLKELKSQLETAYILKNNIRYLYLTIQDNLLMKNEVSDFTYYKNYDGGYVVISNDIIRDDFMSRIELEKNNLDSIYKKAVQKNASFLYVSLPSRINDQYKMKLSGIDYSNEYKDLFLSSLNPDIPILDLREKQEILNLGSSYYKTDHHWNTDAVFQAFKSTIEELNDLYKLNLDPQKNYTNLSNYDKMEILKCFGGSTRVNLGCFLEKEDFKIYIPKYPTSFEYKHFVNNKSTLEKNGDFINSLIDLNCFENPNILNKYNAFLNGGYAENYIYNLTDNNEKKLLLISSSYGRAFAPYISQCFSETAYLDPQQGRFNDNYLEFIDTFEPDVILVLHNEYVNANVGE